MKFPPPYKFLFLTLLFTEHLNHFLEFYWISCRPGWPQPHYGDETGFELLILLSLHFNFGDQRATTLNFTFSLKPSEAQDPVHLYLQNTTGRSLALRLFFMVCCALILFGFPSLYFMRLSPVSRLLPVLAKLIDSSATKINHCLLSLLGIDSNKGSTSFTSER